MKLTTLMAVAAVLALSGTAGAQTLDVSIGIRETGGTGPAFANGGTTGGIEWVNLDGQQLVADGTWQFFEFTPTADTLTAFAGATANSVLDTDWGALEHIRIRNSSGITAPLTVWIDDVVNVTSTGPVSEGFETFAPGDQVLLQEPGFSGSTAGFLVDAGTSEVSAGAAHDGSQSYEMNFQFVDATPTHWVRLTTFNDATLLDHGNAAMQLRDPTGGSTPTIGFWARAVIPEPSSAGILALVGIGLGTRRRR